MARSQLREFAFTLIKHLMEERDEKAFSL